ncbi:hypothetical protein RclHR1_02580001 [Rhizophagus clarus]|nr:hypothetical protein RclHR1_02580001 [Rhizophagus clarus]
MNDGANTSVSYNNNVTISDHIASNSSSNITFSPDSNYQQHIISPHKYQRSTSNNISVVNDTVSNHQQYGTSNNISRHSYQQCTPDHDHQQFASNNTSHQKYQQSMYNNVSQSCHNQNQQSLVPLLNSIINVHSPTNIFVFISSNSLDVQSQLQQAEQVHTHLKQSPLTNTS